jgi:hypothetical protein
MSEQPLQLRVTDGSRVTANPPSIVQRITGSQMTSPPVMPRESRVLLFTLIALVLIASCAWTWITRDRLQSSVVAESSQRIVAARRAFDAARVQTQASLTASCRVLVEDPRLKSTLATEGMDSATVADILQDLARLRGAGFLLVLSPDGRVFAQAGAPELEGLDLSVSSVVKKARDSNDATVGSWVLAGKVMDLSMKSIRYGDALVAFLVVGHPVDETLLAGVEAETGVAVASALANDIVMTSSKDPLITDVFTHVVGQAATPAPRVVVSNGERYIASVAELPETAQAHRLVMVASLHAAAQRFRLVEWLLFVPPVLVLVAVLFVLSAIRSPRRIT